MTEPLENDTIRQLRRHGKALQNGEANDPKLQGKALGSLCEIMADYFERGIVTIPYCAANHAAALAAADAAMAAAKAGCWSWQKAFAVITSTIVFCGTVAGLVIHLTPSF